MQFSDVQQQIGSLPDTFIPMGSIFAGLIESLSALVARSTTAIDQLSSQIDVPTAKFGWLTAIGLLFGIQRNQYESDDQFRTRLVGTLTATRGTPQSIVNFLQLALNLNVTVSEDFINPSYQINFLTPVTTQTIQKVVIAINWVRPAGVPFLPLFITRGGLYLDTCNYFGVKRVTGSYLANPSTLVTVNIGANTNSPINQLPTNYISDQWITGVASVSYPLS